MDPNDDKLKDGANGSIPGQQNDSNSNGTGDGSQHEPSLRETIAAAFKESVDKAATAGDGSPNETVEEKAARVRAANGQFQKKPDAGTGATAATAIPDKNAQTAAGAENQNNGAVPAARVPPRGWSPASKQAFTTLAPFIQDDIIKRESEVDQGFAKYKGLDKHVIDFRAAGVEPEHAIAAYRQAEQLLVSNFDEGVLGLCKQFEKHPLALAEYLINLYRKPGHEVDLTNKGANNGNSGAQPDEKDKQISQLTARLARLEGVETNRQNQTRQQQFAEVEKDIDSVINNADNKFVDNVVDQMVTLIKGAKSEGRKMTAQQAYDAACWLNPQVRDILISDQANAKSKGAAKKANDAANQARSAASSVTGAPAGQPGSKAPKDRTLREDLEAAFEEHRGQV